MLLIDGAARCYKRRCHGGFLCRYSESQGSLINRRIAVIIKQFFVLLGIAVLLSFPSFLANAQELKSPEETAALMETVETRIAELQLINRQIGNAPAVDKEALLYRRDERSFELLVLIDELAQSVILMPEDDALREKNQRAAANRVFNNRRQTFYTIE